MCVRPCVCVSYRSSLCEGRDPASESDLTPLFPSVPTDLETNHHRHSDTHTHRNTDGEIQRDKEIGM